MKFRLAVVFFEVIRVECVLLLYLIKMPKESQILAKDKLKILCLHGYRQNDTTFKSKLGSFRKLANKYAELTFLCAPHQSPPMDGQEEDSEYPETRSCGRLLKIIYRFRLSEKLVVQQGRWIVQGNE